LRGPESLNANPHITCISISKFQPKVLLGVSRLRHDLDECCAKQCLPNFCVDPNELTIADQVKTT
jgi:hypothetical protein